MKTSSRTAVFLSALVTLAGTSFGQSQQNTASAANYNFYITTPQTGQQVTGGAAARTATQASDQQSARAVASVAQPTNAATSARAPQTARVAQQANLYIPQQQSRVPAVASTSAREQSASTQRATRPQRASAGENFTTGQNRGYTIQQVSNPAPALASRSVSRQSSLRNSSTVATSARQSANYTRSSQRQNPVYVSNATASAHQRRGFLGRLLHPHQHSAPQQQQQTAARSQRQSRSSSSESDFDSILSKMRPSKLAGKIQEGVASWYGGDWHGKKTANGERYDMHSMTAAHKSLPFGTLVRVKNERNGRECIVRINNRGPFTKGRIIDLSKAAAGKLGMIGSGIAKVKCEVVGSS